MIDASSVAEIVGQYQRHGWKLRRALLSSDVSNLLAPALENIEHAESDLDALWFSRFSNPETESWELRRLAGSPFALLTAVAKDASLEDREDALLQIEEKMRERRFA